MATKLKEFTCPINAEIHLEELARCASQACQGREFQWVRAFTLDHANLETKPYTGRQQ